MNSCFFRAGVLCLLLSFFALTGMAQPELAWSTFYNHPSNLNDLDTMIGRDAAGNVYMGGSAFAAGDPGGNDIMLVKIDPNGNIVWTRSYNGTGNFHDNIADMAVSPSGNIYIGGTSYSLASSGSVNSYDYVMLKYNTNGDQLWVRHYAGPVANGQDTVRSVKIDASENFYVTGHSRGGSFANYLTLKYDTNGNQLWERRFAGGFGEIPGEVEVDGAGNLYVTGYSGRSGTSGDDDMLTIKYNAEGVQQWTNYYNHPANNDDTGREIEITPDGDVVVMGRSIDTFARSVPILHKIDTDTGVTMWTKPYDLIPGQDEFINSLELDGAGNIIMAGIAASSGQGIDQSVFITKFDPAGIAQ